MMPGAALYVAGFGSGAGKSTTCLSLLQLALRAGLEPSQLAYIKPATQCDGLTDVAAFCEQRGIEAIPLGPVIFRKGLTTTVISGDDYAEQRDGMLKSVIEAVKELRERKQFVLVDGVGYPSVGTCCGLGNARAAAALGTPVLLVGPPGLGDAIDTFEMMSTYFRAHKATVIGAVQNKAVDTDRHRIADALPLVDKWMREYGNMEFYGAMPQVVRLDADNNVLDTAAFAEKVGDLASEKTRLPALVKSLLAPAARQ